MSAVSIKEVEQDRRNDAEHFGRLPPSNVAAGRKVHTGLETTQDGNRQPPQPLSRAKRRELLRRARDKENFRAYLRDTLRSPVFRFVPVEIADQETITRPPDPRRVVVVVERKIFRTLLSEENQVWVDIYKRNDERRSFRPATASDENILQSKYPFLSFAWFDGPLSIDCVGEWVDGEWKLVSVFDPYA